MDHPCNGTSEMPVMQEAPRLLGYRPRKSTRRLALEPEYPAPQVSAQGGRLRDPTKANCFELAYGPNMAKAVPIR
jgi:hypothetical protein